MSHTKRSVKPEVEHGIFTKTVGSSRLKSSVVMEKENEKVKKEMARIDAMELSDLESLEFEAAKQRHVRSAQKRQHDVEEAESIKRKVRYSIPDSITFLAEFITLASPHYNIEHNVATASGICRFR